MSKIIRMKKCVFDPSHPAIPREQAVNPSSSKLTATLLHEGHPLFQKLQQSFKPEDIHSRRIRFDVCGKALYTKHPASGNRMVVFNVALSLQVVMNDAREKQPEETLAQTTMMQNAIDGYFTRQGFPLPCKTSEDMERFLDYLAQSTPEVWNYFRVIPQAS